MEANIKDISFLSQEAKIQNIKYKIFIFVGMMLIYFFSGMLVDSFNEVDLAQARFDSLVEKSKTLEANLDAARKYGDMSTKALAHKSDIQGCINATNKDTYKDCLTIKQDPIIFGNLDLIRTYFMISQLNTSKLDFDQKVILGNLFNFLLKGTSSSVNIISFGIPKLVDYDKNYFELPISLNIDFDNKNSLISFLDRVENRLDINYPVYYKIMSVNYNLANYDQKQTVNITLSAFFYK